MNKSCWVGAQGEAPEKSQQHDTFRKTPWAPQEARFYGQDSRQPLKKHCGPVPNSDAKAGSEGRWGKQSKNLVAGLEIILNFSIQSTLESMLLYHFFVTFNFLFSQINLQFTKYMEIQMRHRSWLTLNFRFGGFTQLDMGHVLLPSILITPFTTLNPSLHLTWLKFVLLLSLGASHYVSTIETESGRNKDVVLAGSGCRTCLYSQ